MYVLSDQNAPVHISSIEQTDVPTHIWALDLDNLDFTLQPIYVLEEFNSPAVEVAVRNARFYVPSMWNILIFDRDTAQLDAVPLAECAGREYTAFVYGPTKTIPRAETIFITNYHADRKTVTPLINRQTMLCHPISESEWVVITPAEVYNRYLKDMQVGDLINA